MNNSQRIRLLLAIGDQSETSRLISTLEGSGINVRPTVVDSMAALEKLISENSYDMLIASEKFEGVTINNALTLFRKKRITISSILLCDPNSRDQSIIQGLKLGVDDVIAFDHDQHLVGSVKREFNNQRTRTELKQAKLSAEIANTHAQQLLDELRTPVAYLQDGMFLFFNDAFRETLGYDDEDDLLIQPISELIDDKDTVKLLTKLGTGEDATTKKQIQAQVNKADDSSFEATLVVHTTEYDGEACNELSIPSHRLSLSAHSNISQIRLPKLNDRKQFVSLAQQAMMKAHQGENRQLSWVQLVDFKQVTEHLGIAERDEMLDTVADWFLNEGSSIGEWSDLGEGQYVVVSDQKSEEYVQKTLSALIEAFNQKIWEIGHASVRLHLRAGISRIGTSSDNIEEYIDLAKAAWNKALDGEQVVLIAENPEGDEKIQSTEDIIKKLKNALENNHFKLLYQPVINIHGNAYEFYEVLLRLIDDDGEEISPSVWRQEVEVAGLGALIDRWVVKESAKQLAKRISQGIETKLLINLSSAALTDSGLTAFLSSIFKAAKLPKDSLIFQMSEKDINRNLKPAIRLTEELAGLQCRAAITHFGSSLSSFDTLNSLVIDWVKIDGSYTQELQDGSSSNDQLKKLITQLKEEGRETIIPMVENASIINKLWQAGASYIQGYYVQAPSSEMQHNFELN